jgi:RNA polymerase sigma factor (sigma-70 family)
VSSPRSPRPRLRWRVRRAVAALPDSQREALVLRYFRDMSVAGTAEVLGKTPGSVKSSTHRALTSLRSEFDIDIGATEEVRDDA